MTDINAALAACKDATDQLGAAAERSGLAWAIPRAPGKWSPSQILEHSRALRREPPLVAHRSSRRFPPYFIRSSADCCSSAC